MQLAFKLSASERSRSKMLSRSLHCHSWPFRAVCTSSGLRVTSPELSFSCVGRGLLLQECRGPGAGPHELGPRRKAKHPFRCRTCKASTVSASGQPRTYKKGRPDCRRRVIPVVNCTAVLVYLIADTSGLRTKDCQSQKGSAITRYYHCQACRPPCAPRCVYLRNQKSCDTPACGAWPHWAKHAEQAEKYRIDNDEAPTRLAGTALKPFCG